MCQNNNLQLNPKHQQTGQPVQILQNAEADPQLEQALQETEGQKLQTEQAAPEQEVRLEESQANETLVAEARQEIETVEAVRTAEGTPVQEQESAPTTWKERRAERNKAKAARKACPLGTAATYDMVEQLKERDKMVNHSMEPYLGWADSQGFDRSGLKAFCQGYRKNRFGSPASEEDKRKKREDERFLYNCCSGNYGGCDDQLDNIVSETIHTHFSLDMFTPYNLRHNLAELKALGERLIHIQNLMASHEVYFSTLHLRNPRALATFKAAGTLGASFVSLLTAHCEANGVDADAAGYLDKAEDIEEARKDLKSLTENFQMALIEYQKRCDEGLNESLRDFTRPGIESKSEQIATEPMRHQQWADENFEQLKGNPHLRLSREELASEAVAKAKNVLIPSKEELNIWIIRVMARIGQNGNQEPSVELYDDARELAELFVQRIWDYPMEWLPSTSDYILTDGYDKFVELTRGAELADDIMRLKQPVRGSRSHGKLTLKEELLGSEENKYTYKCAMLKALAKKARMISLLARAKMEDEKVRGEYLTEEERREAGDTPEIMFRQKLEETEKEIESMLKSRQKIEPLNEDELDKREHYLQYEQKRREQERREQERREQERREQERREQEAFTFRINHRLDF